MWFTKHINQNTKIIMLFLVIGFLLVLATASSLSEALALDKFQMPKLLMHLPIPSSTFQKSQASDITDRIASTPFTVLSGNNAFVVWEQFVVPGFHLPFIALTKSSDGGSNFSKQVDISNSEPPNWPAIAVSGNDSYVVWHDANFLNPDIDYSIFLSRSTDGGKNFSSPINVSNNTQNQVSNLTENNMQETSNFPSIKISESNLFVVWQDRINLANFTCTNQDNTTAHCIAYPVKPVKSSIFLSKSTDGGSNFSKPININTKTEPFHLPLLVFSRPDIAGSGNSVLVAWHQEVSTGNTTSIFLSKSTDGGNNFSKPVDISNNTKYALNPRLAISGNNMYAAWERSYEANPIIKPDIFLSKSTDGGNNFSKP
ncbi:MAG TPA: sialidase family protein, partial [Nitrososphaeraceae archaeon]